MTINYIEKGHGLHGAIASAGYNLREENGAWVADDEAAVQAIIDRYTVADAAAAVCALIDGAARRLRDKAVKSISPGEMASWPVKRAEAERYLATGEAAAAPMLAAEAESRGVTLAAVADRVKTAADRFSRLEAEISGTAGRHKDAVRAATSFDAVAAYDWSTGWPAV